MKRTQWELSHLVAEIPTRIRSRGLEFRDSFSSSTSKFGTILPFHRLERIQGMEESHFNAIQFSSIGTHLKELVGEIEASLTVSLPVCLNSPMKMHRFYDVCIRIFSEVTFWMMLGVGRRPLVDQGSDCFTKNCVVHDTSPILILS